MRYTCKRCKQECFTTNEEHICKDLTKRLKRQSAQVEAVKAILIDYAVVDGNNYETVAISIVGRLNRLGITED